MIAAAASERREAGSTSARAGPPSRLWWPVGSLRLGLVVVLLAHLIVIGWLWRGLARADAEPAFGEAGTFLQTVATWTLIAAFVTAVFTLGPALTLKTCV